MAFFLPCACPTTWSADTARAASTAVGSTVYGYLRGGRRYPRRFDHGDIRSDQAVDTRRWAGVPFYLRAGALGRATEIAVIFAASA